MIAAETPAVEAIFQRSLSAHISQDAFILLQNTTVLVAGLGGGSNIAELLVRKGIGRLIIADNDIFEEHNIRQRGCTMSSLGRNKSEVMEERLLDINPHVRILSAPRGVTGNNVGALVAEADYIIDMIDFSAIREKVLLYREARRMGRFVLTAPSVVHGAILYVFSPSGVTFEKFFDYEEGLPAELLGERMMRNLIHRFPAEAPAEMYFAAARGERTIPLDAVGVDQAAVLTVSSLVNLILGNHHRVLIVPRGLQIDVSNPMDPWHVIDCSGRVGT